MATQIRNLGRSSDSPGGQSTPKPDLLFKIDDFAESVNGAAIIAREDGVITISEDR